MKNKAAIFEYDFIRENRLIRILASGQIVAILLCLILWLALGSKAAGVTLLLALLALLFTGAIIFLTFRRYKRVPKVVEKGKLTQRSWDISAKIDDVKNKISSREAEIQAIDQKPARAGVLTARASTDRRSPTAPTTQKPPDFPCGSFVYAPAGENRSPIFDRVGHSGNSLPPHLHSRLMDNSSISTANGIPCAFE